MKQKTYLDKLMENKEFKEKFEEEYKNLQTNENREEKRIVEVYDWKDYRYEYNPWGKKYNRKLRRKRQKRLLDKAIWEAILKA